MKSEYLVSVDDGSLWDLEVANMLKERGIKGVFYIPGNCEISDEQIIDLSKDFEIGSHTISHPILSHIPLEQAKHEIEVSKQILEQLIGKPVTKFCYPKGKYNEGIKKLVMHAGYEEARTVDVLCTDFPSDPFAVKTSLHIYPRKEYEGRAIIEVARDLIHKVKYQGGRFEVWCHGWEIQKLNLWTEFEMILNLMK